MGNLANLSVVAAVLSSSTCSEAEPPPAPGALAIESIHGARFQFGGVIGQRVEANLSNWLLTAPDANPGMIEMFRKRDRQPAPQLVPWAGEFIGKYLISAIQARRMTDDPRLDKCLQEILHEFIATQAEDGYLGPFPREQRLLGNWDLWGHHHAMLALLMWYADTGDKEALQCAVRAADLICNTYLDTPRRILNAASHEMNMAVIHSLGWLYRITGNERYLRMVHEIEKDWESAGDYFRTGIAGIPFYRTPRPRWESLHDLQGLVERYRITGDERYKQAFVNHWTSIMQHDRHPSGAFSTGEQAVGNPYSPGAIETCCTTAWMALTVDMLRLTGDPMAAEELELSTWNSMLGSQHPSGRWWTYNTPMDGVREASAHTIVFQARCGTPELNCCSVNGPRGLGMLSEWAIMRDAAGPLVNFYGSCRSGFSLVNGIPVVLTQKTDFPAKGEVRLAVGLKCPTQFNLRLRIPRWSSKTEVRVNGRAMSQAAVRPGTYLSVQRRWQNGDTIELRFDMSPHHWTGELSRTGRAALYVGPILLAFDQHFNTMDTNAIPPLDLAKVRLTPAAVQPSKRPEDLKPMMLWQATARNGQKIVLCDFATAGTQGTDYVAWLPVVNAGPPPVWLLRPRPGERVAAGPVLFEWTAYGHSRAQDRAFALVVSKDRDSREVVVQKDGLSGSRHVVREGLAAGLTYYWKLTATNQQGSTEDLRGPQPFTVDASLPNTVEEEVVSYQLGERNLMVASPLDGKGKPSFGVLASEVGVLAGDDRFGREGGAVAFGGEGCAIKYRLPYFPEDNFTFYAWVCPEGLPTQRLQQVFSAWATFMDDPLRVVFHGSSLFARIEAQQGFGTEGVGAQNGQWIHVAAAKQGTRLSLYVNGELRHTANVPEFVFSAATDFALGANPHFGGNECFIGRIDDFAFHAQAFTAEEIAAQYRAGKL